MPSWSRRLSARLGPPLAALLLQCFCLVRARSENRVDYRYEDYIEDDDRIHIRTHAVYAEQALNSQAVVKGNFVYDGISGATPTGAAAPAGTDRLPLQNFQDIRRAGSVELDWTAGRFISRPQVAYSEESDYRSIGLSWNQSIEFNQKNTVLNLGVSRNFDQVTGFWLRNKTIWKDKDTWDTVRTSASSRSATWASPISSPRSTPVSTPTTGSTTTTGASGPTRPRCNGTRSWARNC